VTITLPPGAASDLVLASDAADATAVDAVRAHHAELAGGLAVHVATLLSSAAARDGAGSARARAAAGAFCREHLLPHAAAEERTLYPAAAAAERLRLLVDAMVLEHRVLESLVEQVTTADDPVQAAASGHALRVLFETHLAKEEDFLLPAVAADPAVSLAGVLAGMHELLGEPAADGAADDADLPHSGCACGGHDDSDVPLLDVREVPHAIRHATVFGAFDAVPDGGSLLLVAPHDPLPLLGQLSARFGGALRVDYEERGPDAWRLRLTRG
jgi:uncharacterized protein (DUF2249 family)